LRRIALTMSLAAGCATHSPAPRPPGSDAAQRLRSIGDRYWDALLATTTLPALNQNGIGYLGGPLYATSIGDHRFDDKLDDQVWVTVVATGFGTPRARRREAERPGLSERNGLESRSSLREPRGEPRVSRVRRSGSPIELDVPEFIPRR